MDTSYQVVFRGKLVTGVGPEQAAANLASLLKVDPTRAQALLQESKLVLKRGLSKEIAQRYQEALRQAGLVVAVVGETPVGSGAAYTPAAPAASAAADAAAAGATGTGAGSPGEPGLAEVGATLSEARRVPAPAIATDHLSIAEVGAVLDPSGPPKPARSYDLSALKLDEAGATLAEARKVEPPKIDLSGLSLADAPAEPERGIPDFLKRSERE